MINNTNSLNIPKGIIRSGNVPSSSESIHSKNKSILPEKSFNEVFETALKNKDEVKFSKHAELRLQSRNIVFSDATKQKIADAVKKADSKGIKDSLVILDQTALVVNVKSRTVITAVNQKELSENVFTNIDGAVFI